MPNDNSAASCPRRLLFESWRLYRRVPDEEAAKLGNPVCGPVGGGLFCCRVAAAADVALVK
jgi:hypothetical protein